MIGRRPPRALRPLLAMLLALLGALLLGAVLILATGHDPLQAYGAMVWGAFGGRNWANLVATLARATPIVGMGLAAAVAFRAGFFNLGGEGQLVLGGLATAVVALYVPLPAVLLLPTCLLAAVLAGGAWAWLAAFFEFRWGVPLLISTLLFNYPARSLASYLVNHPLRDVASGMSQTFRLPQTVQLPALGSSQLHAGNLLVLGLVLVAAYLSARTRFGYEARMAGLNHRFVRYGGVRVERLGYGAMFLSGAVAGLVGAVQVLAVHQRFIDGALTQPLYAWIGLMAALLVGSTPLGVLAAGLFFAAIQTGGFGMERATEVPREIGLVLQALIILLVAAGRRFPFGGRAEEEGQA